MNKKLKIVFLGTPKFSDVVLKELIENDFKPSLIITCPDKPVGRKQIITPSPIKETAEKHSVSISQPQKITTIESQIKKLKPDLIIAAAYGAIVPKEILDIPRYGCLNLHPSLLPKYRGPSPIQATILNGDQKTGVTVIKMTEGLDQGPILASLNFIIGNIKMNYQELEDELAKLGAKLLIDVTSKWTQGKIEPTKQIETKATYTELIKKEDGKINWASPAIEIERKIRAFDPWPGTFCQANGKYLKILKSFVLKETESGPFGSPGKVYLAPDDRIAIQCKPDYLIVEELQFEGKTKMRIEDFLKGNIDFIGTILK